MSADKKHDLTGALLLNALIMPGSGHYAMGFKLRGSLIMGSIMILVILPVVRFTGYVLTAIHSAGKSSAPMIRTLSTMGDAWRALQGFILACVIAILAIWIYSIIDLAVRMKK